MDEGARGPQPEFVSEADLARMTDDEYEAWLRRTGNTGAAQSPAPPRGPQASGAAAAPRRTVSIARPAGLLVIVGLLLAWLMVVIVEPTAHESVGVVFALFGVPMLLSAITLQLIADRYRAGLRVEKTYLWWLLLVLPAGLLIAFLIAGAREPEAFFAARDGGYWTTLFMPLLIAVSLALGGLLWALVVWPLVRIVRGIGQIRRGEATAGVFLVPVVALVLGAGTLFLALSVRTSGSNVRLYGQLSEAQVELIKAVLGVPGDYRVLSEPGLWVARIIIILLLAAGIAGMILSRRDGGGKRDSVES